MIRCGRCGNELFGGAAFDLVHWAYRQFPGKEGGKGLYFCSWHCLQAWRAEEIRKRAEKSRERRELMMSYGTTEEKRVKVRELLKQGKTIDEIKREVHCGYALVKAVADELSAEQQAGESVEPEELELEKSPGGYIRGDGAGKRAGSRTDARTFHGDRAALDGVRRRLADGERVRH